ncbi:uncharacterized protein WM277_023311 [Molossus nigricans]
MKLNKLLLLNPISASEFGRSPGLQHLEAPARSPRGPPLRGVDLLRHKARRLHPRLYKFDLLTAARFGLGSSRHVVLLDPVAAGWSSCMRAIAATALLVKEAQKLTLGQDLQIIGGHTTEALLRSPPDRWISNARLTQYQVLLLNPPQVTFSKSTALNPATLLPDGNQGELLHDCHSLLDSIEGTRPDLKDEQIANSDYDLYTDGSSFIRDGTQYAGAAVVTNLQVIWAQALPHGTSAQKAELIALTQALSWAKEGTKPSLVRQKKEMT